MDVLVDGSAVLNLITDWTYMTRPYVTCQMLPFFEAWFMAGAPSVSKLSLSAIIRRVVIIGGSKLRSSVRILDRSILFFSALMAVGKSEKGN